MTPYAILKTSVAAASSVTKTFTNAQFGIGLAPVGNTSRLPAPAGQVGYRCRVGWSRAKLDRTVTLLCKGCTNVNSVQLSGLWHGGCDRLRI